MTVLVAYASGLGSTAEIAQHMASRLAAAVDAVECRSVEEVESVSGYEAVIVGSAIHNQAWLSPAAAFFSVIAAESRSASAWPSAQVG